MLFIITGLSGRAPAVLSFSRYQTNSTLPVTLKSGCTNFPSGPRYSTATRSASGSDPTIQSAPSRSASSSARRKLSGYSGFGEATVEKSPSGTICSGTQNSFSAPMARRARGITSRPVPWNGV